MRHSLPDVSNPGVRSGLFAAVAAERRETANVLVYMAEFDERKLYLPEGYGSMREYCVAMLHYSEDATYKRIQAARAARRFPAIFDAVAERRLHLCGVCLLAPHLTPETAAETAAELIAAATHKSKAEIELLLAERFPKADVPTRVRELAPVPIALPVVEAAPEMPLSPRGPESAPAQLAPGQVEKPSQSAPIAPHPATPQHPMYPRVRPLSPRRFAIQFTMEQRTHDKLREVQDLLGHEVARSDLAQVFDLALDALRAELRKRKLAETKRPRSRRRPTAVSSRHIPAHVKRAVHARDGGRCTFVSESGRRCEATSDLEYDHIRERARGGETSIDNIRLRCRPHNQHTAERTFGTEFMRHKRGAAVEERAAARSAAAP